MEDPCEHENKPASMESCEEFPTDHRSAAESDVDSDDDRDEDKTLPNSSAEQRNKQCLMARSVPSRKTRDELNLIEKERTLRINSQILTLRALLENSNIDTKKDKFSVLKSTYEYMEHLKNKYQHLDIVSKRVRASKRPPSSDNNDMDAQSPKKQSILPTHGLIYQRFFSNSATPLVLLDLDGHFVTYNSLFSQLTGYTSEELNRISVFNLAHPDDMDTLLKAMRAMLTFPHKSVRHFWGKFRFRTRDEDCYVSMWTVRQPSGQPMYVEAMLISLEDCIGVGPLSSPAFKQHLERSRAMQKEGYSRLPMRSSVPVSVSGVMGGGGNRSQLQQGLPQTMIASQNRGNMAQRAGPGASYYPSHEGGGGGGVSSQWAAYGGQQQQQYMPSHPSEQMARKGLSQVQVPALPLRGQAMMPMSLAQSMAMHPAAAAAVYQQQHPAFNQSSPYWYPEGRRESPRSNGSFAANEGNGNGGSNGAGMSASEEANWNYEHLYKRLKQ